MFQIPRYTEEAHSDAQTRHGADGTGGGDKSRQRLESLKAKAAQHQQKKDRKRSLSISHQDESSAASGHVSGTGTGTGTDEAKHGERGEEGETKAERKARLKAKRRREKAHRKQQDEGQDGDQALSNTIAPFAEFTKVSRPDNSSQQQETAPVSERTSSAHIEEDGQSKALEQQQQLYQQSQKDTKKKKKKKKSSTPVVGKSIWRLPQYQVAERSTQHPQTSGPVHSLNSSSSSKSQGTNSEASPQEFLEKKMKINELLVRNLRKQGIERLFPIQREAIPEMVAADNEHQFGMGDICISAPTGSGKTLVYVVPIVQTLMKRVIPRLRALIIVPTHELVNQVYETFKNCSEGTTLRIVSMTTEMPFLEQQEILQESDAGYIDARNLPKTGIDILISTPGRLIDHLDNTPGFTLEHLQ
eukprot:gb/GECG01011400.1/.p1 GENE.gb/GECG01011400.1/~~gb/GECG01011400.1/.p1  ORF type:complete len:416 (+),score=73.97 gb/GECG01011400.1/:1-1248(+)